MSKHLTHTHSASADLLALWRDERDAHTDAGALTST
jgi:hypothetical protein